MDRSLILREAGAAGEEIAELLKYNQNVFKINGMVPDLPLPDEPFAEAWEGYMREAQKRGLWPILQEQLVQLQFPIQGGISQTEYYLAATRRGEAANRISEASGLNLVQPENLKLVIHQTPAGKIPLLLISQRQDFVSLVQALTARNEPSPIPDSMGAQMVAGYNNWGRIRSYRLRWEKAFSGTVGKRWEDEFKSLIPRKELYQDRFILLSDGPYSAVPAEELGLTEEEWKDFSLLIRREHECAHYFTRRVFGSMRNNMLDELIADYMGIVTAAGRYRSDWFLRFLGLDIYPDCRTEGRINNYQGNPPLSEGAFAVLKGIVKLAAENLEVFDTTHRTEISEPGGRTIMLMTLASITLEELASREAQELLEKVFSDHDFIGRNGGQG